MPNGKATGLVVLLVGMAVGWAAASSSNGPQARVEASVAGAGSSQELVAFATESPNAAQLLYLIDPKQKILSVYEFDSRKTKLKLAAVRHYSADHQLAEFNNEAPYVADIEKLVRQR